MKQARIQIHIMHWSAAAALSQPVRQSVYIEEQNIPAEMEWDGLDDSAQHAIATDSDDLPVGCARLLPSGQIGRMAVLKHWRKKGIGADLLAAMELVALEHDHAAVFLHAQHQAMPFYSRYNYLAVGENFKEAGIPHVRMNKILSGQK